MDMETTITKNVETADDKVNKINKIKYDAACKRLLSEKSILAWIMKDCLEEYAECDVKEIAEKYIQDTPQIATVAIDSNEMNATSMIYGVECEDVTKREETIPYDIRFSALAPISKDLIQLSINVEEQDDFYLGYSLVKRGNCHCGQMISSQYGTEFTGEHYEKIKKVYSIWICMNPPKDMENTITQYSIKEENLLGNVSEKKENYDLMDTIMIYLGEPDGENYHGVLKLLNVLLSSKIDAKEKKKILEEEFQIEVTQTIESELLLLCDLSNGVEE